MTSRTTLTKPEETLLFDNPALLPHNPAPGTQLPKGNACATCGTVREWFQWTDHDPPRFVAILGADLFDLLSEYHGLSVQPSAS